jgi:hypothetical protein
VVVNRAARINPGFLSRVPGQIRAAGWTDFQSDLTSKFLKTGALPLDELSPQVTRPVLWLVVVLVRSMTPMSEIVFTKSGLYFGVVGRHIRFIFLSAASPEVLFTN